MKNRIPAIIFMAVSVGLICVAVVLGLSLWNDGPDEPETAQTEPAAPESQGDGGASSTIPAAQTAASGSTDAQWSGPVVKEQEAPMGAAYFADAAFLGNSITSRLWYYDNDDLLPDGTDHWYWAESLTIQGAMPYVAQMPADTFGKVYIGLGMYEVNYNKDTLRTSFNAVIDQIQASQPGAIIYLMSVTPVSKWCNENRDYKRNAVQNFNRMLQDIAKERQVWYLDVYPALCGEDGFLPSEVTPDGIQMNPEHYEKWFEYLRTHYVPDGTPPEPTEVPAEPTPEAEE